ncbi:peptidoglycan-binding protein [Candidatus Peregrinibacteria bacterium]|nr:peptidoglycan-binding protein [Candidatus Peregrinibacteria bacterium]
MKKQIQKIIGVIILLLQILTAAPSVLGQDTPGEKKLMLITGYYSPLPNQSYYVRGSYEADVRLNGRGTNGADGTEVYTGMLAAPKTYAFGTRVKIPGLGVGEVHDRGGAIVARSNYDRIDIWMGKGEEGLARALNWGARFVECEVYRNPEQVEPGLSFGWVGNKLPESVENKLRNKTIQNPQVFSKPIQESNNADIKELQEALIMFGYYHGAIDGNYDDKTREAVLTFQLAEGVISNKNDAGAGNFGPKTQETLKRVLEDYNSEIINELERLQANREMLIANLGKMSSGEDVVNLQLMLWEIGYYLGPLDGAYDEKTINAVYNFQLDFGVVQNEWTTGAGYYGKQTHSALYNAVEKKMEVVRTYPREMQIWVPAKKDLPMIATLQVEPVALERQELHFSSDLMNKKLVHSSALVGMTISTDLSLNDKGEEVVKLQDILIKEGFLSAGLNTGYYGNQTKTAVLKYQLQKGIVNSEFDAGAGRVGPQTRATLNS